MARLLPTILTVLVLLWPGLARAETPDEYRAAVADAVQTADAALSTLPPDASLADHPPLQVALQRLEAIDHVTTTTGASVIVDNSHLIQRLRGDREEGRQAIDSLRQLLGALEASAQRSEWTPAGAARAELDQVLARPEFHEVGGNPIAQFFDQLRRGLRQWLENVIPGFRLPELPDLSFLSPLEAVLWVIAGALVVFALAFFIYTWRSARQSLARHAALAAKLISTGEDARSAKLAAQQAADEGDYRLAVHYLYLWAVLHLSERSQLRYDRSLTNHEHLRMLPIGGEVAHLMRKVVEAFDRIWYGHATCTAVEYAQFRGVIERIVEATT
ncbi:MAG: DUF4129 domain-containing protein [Chloroflexota bacterium]